MFITIVVGFFTSRLVLDSLGETDFGIYSLIGGFILFFVFINGAMAGAIQRFLNAALGKKNVEETIELFNAAIIVHIGISIIVLIISNTFGTWFIEQKMQIPPERYSAAFWVFQSVIWSFVFRIIATPAQASLLAYERMGIVSSINLLAPIGRLVAILVASIIDRDKLITYAILVLFFSLLQALLFYVYSYIKCESARLQFCTDRSKYKKLTSYAGWDLLGNLVGVFKDQGTPILLNMFFGVHINAALGIVNQLSTNLRQLSQRAVSATTPQMIQEYSAGNTKRSTFLANTMSKLGFAILFTASFPLIIETKFILNFWLKEIPEFTILFVQYALIVNLIESISHPLLSLVHATGKIKLYHLTVTVVYALQLPFLYLFLKLDYSPEICYLIAGIISIGAQLVRLILLKKIAGYSIVLFVKDVLSKIVSLVLCAVLLIYIVKTTVDNSIFLILITPLLIVVLVWFIILEKDQKEKITQKLKRS